MLDDLGHQITHAEKDLKQAVVDRKVQERKLDEARKKESEWTTRAEQALGLGDEQLARAALGRRTEVSSKYAPWKRP